MRKCQHCGKSIHLFTVSPGVVQWDAEGPACNTCTVSPDGEHEPFASLNDFVQTNPMTDLTTRNVCDKCGQPVHQAAPDADPQAAKWYHDHIADDVFCGLVMHAADRLPK